MSKKSLLLIEIVWAVLGLVCLGIAIREISLNGLRGSWLWLLMSAVAFALAAVRDSQRKKM
ncbi:MAG: hypothetical protein P1P83_10565 [Bacteroidales bacterium]|jgi:F0F1-type ATP synthase assembly protein I|nr:hypothetical protein [Bacteroidales bacterium]MDT8374880.1 hypothetical protein [Bacteroidales bacterium]